MDTTQGLLLLGLVLAALALWRLWPRRAGLSPLGGEMVRWALVFTVAGGIYAFGGQIIEPFRPDQSVDANAGVIELPRRADGHYYLDARVNGAPITFVVDTGATGVVLSREDAARAGIDPGELAYIHTANTANGTVRIAPVRLDSFEVEGIRDDGLRAFVNEGDLFGSLLGMTYLRRFEKIIITRDMLRLER